VLPPLTPLPVPLPAGERELFSMEEISPESSGEFCHINTSRTQLLPRSRFSNSARARIITTRTKYNLKASAITSNGISIEVAIAGPPLWPRWCPDAVYSTTPPSNE